MPRAVGAVPPGAVQTKKDKASHDWEAYDQFLSFFLQVPSFLWGGWLDVPRQALYRDFFSHHLKNYCRGQAREEEMGTPMLF